jgi:hypothetical protein
MIISTMVDMIIENIGGYMEPLDPRRNVYEALEKFKQLGTGRESVADLVNQFINLQNRDIDAMTRADNTKKTLTGGFALVLAPYVIDPNQFYVPLLPCSSSSSSEEA